MEETYNTCLWFYIDFQNVVSTNKHLRMKLNYSCMFIIVKVPLFSEIRVIEAPTAQDESSKLSPERIFQSGEWKGFIPDLLLVRCYSFLS